MFGMVQPKNKSAMNPEVYSIGCLGKIISFNETDDKRFIISLSGQSIAYLFYFVAFWIKSQSL